MKDLYHQVAIGTNRRGKKFKEVIFFLLVKIQMILMLPFSTGFVWGIK